MDVINSIDRDAQEFALCIKQGGWRMGLLVARNVKAGTGQGKRNLSENSEKSEKVSLASFAQKAGIDDKTVKKYLDAWNLAAEKGHVQPSDALHPDEEPGYIDVDKLPSWKTFFQPRKPKETKTKEKTKETTQSTTSSTAETKQDEKVEEDNLDEYEDEFERAEDHKELNSQTRPTNSFVTYNEKYDMLVNTFLGTMFDIHDQFPSRVVDHIAENKTQFNNWIDKLEMTHRALETYINTLKDITDV